MPVAHLAVAAAAGCFVGAAAAFGYYKSVIEEQKAGTVSHTPSAALDASVHPALKYGMPIRQRVRQFSGHVLAFDPATRNPSWVLEHLNKKTAYGEGDRRKSEFQEDKLIAPRFRSKMGDYAGSGLDRGHMAPAMNHKHSQQRMNDTFTLSNISPQVGKGFNQDYWARFEKFVKDIVKRADDVYIVTGPMYTPSLDPSGGLKMDYKLIGNFPENVAVPTHYYKVIMAESRDKSGNVSAAVGAFVMPNAPIDPRTPLLSFAMPVEIVESVTGIQFFPNYLSDTRRKAVDTAALGAIRKAALDQKLHKFFHYTKAKKTVKPASRPYTPSHIDMDMPSPFYPWISSHCISSSGHVPLIRICSQIKFHIADENTSCKSLPTAFYSLSTTHLYTMQESCM